MEIAHRQLTGGILAGGQGRRLGGIDKGWYLLAGQPLVEHVLARVRGQLGGASGDQSARIVISANRSLDRYRSLGVPVVADDGDDHYRPGPGSGPGRGPLAGIASLLRAATTPYVLITPVDTPLLPLDLAQRLAGAMQPATEIAVASTPDRLQPLHVLMHRSVLDSLEAALCSGERSVQTWQESLHRVTVAWPEEQAFANINSKADARAVEPWLR